MNFVFLMDPLETVMMEKDTSFILMLESYKRGHNVYFFPDGGLVLDRGRVSFHVTKVAPQQQKETPFILHEKTILLEDDVDCVWIRTDPPFDYQYLMHTWILDRLSKKVVMINRPSGIRAVNEKIWATQFTSIVPRTMVAQNKNALLKFLDDEKDIVVKPTDGFGGQSVFRIKQGDVNTNVILETITKNFSREVIAQPFIPEAQNGDKRIILLNGEPLGAVLRVHSTDDYRNNLFSGGKPEATDITEHEKKVIDILKPELQRMGLYFVGIDILGDYLIEVNVTSPTCLQEMNMLYNQNLEAKVIDFAEQLIKTCCA
ncbi:MAG: glutathione synthase [Candidatus Omnitrophica bacterium]|nr:glutathione synthase [Candidatus Omnitrophota bacterium]